MVYNIIWNTYQFLNNLYSKSKIFYTKRKTRFPPTRIIQPEIGATHKLEREKPLFFGRKTSRLTDGHHPATKHTHTPIETNPKVGDGEVLNDCRRTAAEPVRRRPQLRVHTITKDGQASQTGGHQQGTRTIRQSEKIRKTPSNIRGRSQCCPAVMDASKTPVVSQSTMPRWKPSWLLLIVSFSVVVWLCVVLVLSSAAAVHFTLGKCCQRSLVQVSGWLSAKLVGWDFAWRFRRGVKFVGRRVKRPLVDYKGWKFQIKKIRKNA